MKVPLIAVGVVVAGACVAGALVAAVVAAADAQAFFVATGLTLFVAPAVAFVEDDDEADATAVAPCPAIGAPAMLIGLVDPN